MQVTIQLPDAYFFEQYPGDVANQVKLYTALLLYHSGRVSAGAACSIAEIDRQSFLYECKKYGVEAIKYSSEDIDNELSQFD